jgi:hypothetical protein
METKDKRIFVAIDELGFSSELAKQTSIAEDYSKLQKQLPDYCKKPFSNYVTDSNNYVNDFQDYCHNTVAMDLKIGKKMELVNENWFQYRDSLDSIRIRMNECLMFSNEISNGKLTDSAITKLRERFSTYAEGNNIAIFKKAIECEQALNELNELLQKNERTPLINFSQFNSRYFKRSNNVVEMDYINLLY